MTKVSQAHDRLPVTVSLEIPRLLRIPRKGANDGAVDWEGKGLSPHTLNLMPACPHPLQSNHIWVGESGSRWAVLLGFAMCLAF